MPFSQSPLGILWSRSLRLLPQCWECKSAAGQNWGRAHPLLSVDPDVRKVSAVFGDILAWLTGLQNTGMATSVRKVRSHICGSSEMVSFIMGTFCIFHMLAFKSVHEAAWGHLGGWITGASGNCREAIWDEKLCLLQNVCLLLKVPCSKHTH